MADQPQKARLSLRSRLWPVIAGFTLVIQLISPFRGWVFILIGLGGAWLISYVWTRSLLRSLRFAREMRFGWAQVGDRMEERFTLVNIGLIPALWVEIADQSTMPEYLANQVRSVSAGGYTRWRTKGVCTRRGLFNLGPTILRTGDPFGIYQAELSFPGSTSILVTPPVVPLPAIEVAAGGRVGRGRPRTDAPEQTVSSGGVREYLPGDSLRWVHWPTSARREDFYVRIFEGTPAGDWWIILDLDSTSQAGVGEDSTIEHGVILAASLCSRGLRTGRAVGLIVNGDPAVWIPPHFGDEHRWKIFRGLAMAQPIEKPLGAMLTRAQSMVKYRSSLVVITPAPGSKWIEALIPHLWRGTVPTVILLDPVSYGGSRKLGGEAPLLADLGIKHYILDRSLFDKPEARPGKAGRWEWRITSLGRAIPMKAPQDVTWKPLS